MVALLDIDLLNSRDRQRAAEQLFPILRSLNAFMPSRAMVGYGGLLLGIGLWLLPISNRVHPRFTLGFTTAAAAVIAASQGRLETLQDEIDERTEDKHLRLSLKQSAREQIETTRVYAQTAQHRLSHSMGLPAHLVEPDLIAPEDAPTGKGVSPGKPSVDEFDEFFNSAINGDEDKTDTIPSAPGSDLAKPPSVSAAAKSKYKTSTRKNPQNPQVTERTVDLSGHDEYCGLPIVDLAHLMAVDIRGCLGIGSTGCGKSELLKQAIAAQHRLNETSDFTIFAHKSANKAKGEKLNFAGMEKSDDCYVFTASQTGPTLEKEARRFASRVNQLTSLLESGSAVPSVIVIDQSNQGMKAADRAHREAKQRKDRYNANLDPGEPKDRYPVEHKYLADDYALLINNLLVDGREKGMKAWSFGHSNTNDGTGLSHQIKKNVFFIGLGRAGNYQAVENPLVDARFIAFQETRDRLFAQLAEYRKQHQKAGSPVNVVIAITDCGDQGWRLVVLPQYAKVKPITLGVTNPRQDGLPPEVPPTKKEQPKMDIEKQRAQLERSHEYTSDQIAAARDFISWLKINHVNHVDSRGYLDPQSVWDEFPGVRSPSEMEIILQIISEQGGGSFHSDSATGNLKWQPVEKLLPVPEQRPAIVVEPQEPAEILSREAISAIFDHLAKKQAGVLMTPKGFLDSSRKLRPVYGVTLDQLSQVLEYLAEKEVVQLIGKTNQQFKYLGQDRGI